MGMLGLFGEKMNAVSDAAAITPTPAANALLPATALGDGDPGQVFRFGSLTSTPKVVFDIDRIGADGDFEVVSGFPVGWTENNSGGSDVTRDTTPTNFNTGAASAKFTPAGGGIAGMFRDIVVRAGQRIKLSFWWKTDGTGDMECIIRNQQTGFSWDPTGGSGSGSWNPGSLSAFSRTGVGSENKSTEITVQDFATCGSGTTVIRVAFQGTVTGGNGWVDTVLFSPGISFASVHGHNIDPRSAPITIDSSGDDISYTTRGTISTVTKPSMYVTFGVQYFRYWRIIFTDQQSAASGPISMGEVVLGEALTLARGPLYPFRRTSRAPQIRIARQVGGPAIVGHGTMEQRTIPLSFRCRAAQRSEFLNEVFRRSMTGAPGVIVPNTDHPEVHFGVLSEEYPEEWPAKNYLDYSTTLEELAFPLVTG